MNDLTEMLRPHVGAIQKAATAGNAKAAMVIDLYQMHVRSPSDPAAPALCEAAFRDWLATPTA